MGRWARRAVSEWEAIFKAQAGAGGSAAEFCRGRDLNYEQFLYFRKKMMGQRGPRALTIDAMSSPLAESHGFIPVKVDGCNGVRLRFPRGLILESDGPLPPMWVAEVAECWARSGGGLC